MVRFLAGPGPNAMVRNSCYHYQWLEWDIWVQIAYERWVSWPLGCLEEQQCSNLGHELSVSGDHSLRLRWEVLLLCLSSFSTTLLYLSSRHNQLSTGLQAPTDNKCTYHFLLYFLPLECISISCMHIISNNSSFCQIHPGVPDGSDGSDRSSYPLISVSNGSG